MKRYFAVQVDSELSAERVQQLLNQMLNAGYSEAVASEDCDDISDDMKQDIEDVLNMTVEEPFHCYRPKAWETY